MSYDSGCLALASKFLSDCPAPLSTDPYLAQKLAQQIQDLIEEFIQVHDVTNTQKGDQP